MNLPQDEQVDQLFHAAIALPRAERAAFLARAGAADEEVRREVERLLNGHERAGGVLDAPVWAAAAESLATEAQSLMSGRRLDHYQIISLLGKGGMGEVYLARDARLERQVALKLLPADFTHDAERVRRFAREAKAASALNHPNILTIYEIGEIEELHFIATESIEGVTLRARRGSGPLALPEALKLTPARQRALSPLFQRQQVRDRDRVRRSARAADRGEYRSVGR